MLRALEPDPQNRFLDATALAPALDRRDDSEAVAVAPIPRPGRATAGEGADQLLALARELGAQAVAVDEAARLLELALAANPSLRPCHGHRLRLWRKGVLT